MQMFHTFDHAEIQFPPEVSQKGLKNWWFVEYNLFLPWYHVTYETHFEGEDTPWRLVRCFMDLEHFKEFAKSKDVKIIEPCIVTPEHMNGSNQWLMEPIKEIWIGNNPEFEDDYIHTFVLRNGKKYHDSYEDIPEEKLLNNKLIIKF